MRATAIGLMLLLAACGKATDKLEIPRDYDEVAIADVKNRLEQEDRTLLSLYYARKTAAAAGVTADPIPLLAETVGEAVEQQRQIARNAEEAHAELVSEYAKTVY